MSNQASLGDISDGNDKVEEESETSERTILGEIPDDWDSDIVENLFNLTNGSAREDRSSSRNTSETEGEFDVYGANGKIAKYEDSNLDKGLVVGRVGTVGSVYEIDQPAWVSDNAIKAKLDSDNNLRFLYYVMKRGRLDSLANQTAHPLLNQGIVGSVRLPTPEKDEQRRIASVLYNVDQAISKTEEIIEQTQRVKKGLMQDLFEDIHGEDSFPLEDAIEDIRYGTDSKSNQDGDGVPTLRIPNIVGRKLTFDDLKHTSLSEDEREKLKVEEGDLLIIRTNGNPDYVGQTVVFPDTEEDYVFASYLIRIRVDQDKILPKFLSKYLNSEIGRREMNGWIRTSAGNYNLGITAIEKFSIPEVDEDKQRKVIDKIECVEEAIEKYKNEKEQLQRLKKGLMQDLLTGSVRTGEDVRVLDEVVV
ncbi:hypothetical protein GLU64_01625 [Nanohaloarchaea archaeon]|nr:hypothetical protein [Candidatus Nanohaloarchaea archaeon]